MINKMGKDAVSGIEMLFIIRDTLDNICEIGDVVMTTFEETERKLEQFPNTKITDLTLMQEITSVLPPKNIAALVAALVEVVELGQSAASGDPKEQLNMVKDHLARVRNIRDNLRVALEGVDP